MSILLAKQMRHEYVTPEHLLYGLLKQSNLLAMFETIGDVEYMKSQIERVLETIEQVPETKDYSPDFSIQSHEVIGKACFSSKVRGDEPVAWADVLLAISTLKNSMGQMLLKDITLENWEYILKTYDETYITRLKEASGKTLSDLMELLSNHMEIVVDNNKNSDVEFEEVDGEEEDSFEILDTDMFLKRVMPSIKNRKVIGREKEVEDTLEVLCRKSCNSVIHIGESGVGKTSLIYGVVARLNKGEVPMRLKKTKVYQLNMAPIIAGAQYKGEAEKRLAKAFDMLLRHKNAIMYIDDIHALLALGNNGEAYSDMVGVIKKYIDEQDVKIIASTTYSDYKKYLERHSSLMNRFQQINIAEPSKEDTLKILNGLKSQYEKHHGIKISAAVRNEIVELTERYLPNEYNPQKSIKLMDAAGSYHVMHTSEQDKTLESNSVLKALSKMCNLTSIENIDEMQSLLTLSERMKSKIYGQDKAIDTIVDAIQVSKAGLVDDNKPIASLLFVGPTGVGKTEVARTLAEELGIGLVRFDMSEYVEKHTVAKLIGSPAGYVGYDEGGLLTDAIHKTPHCVLLLDEIEKAHADIYNILLQVMDYGYLTDNKGRKSSFRHVILLMTSNAGAQYAHVGSSLGFSTMKTKGDIMKKDLKMLFKPEFINRLSGTIVFNDMDESMARQILEKKLNNLAELLKKKSVKMEVTTEAFDYMLKKGYTKEYGAREFDRIISSELKTLFVKAILSFDEARRMRKISVRVKDEKLTLVELKR